MKFVLTFFAAITLVYSSNLPLREKVRITRNTCIRTSHLSSDHVEMIDNFIYPNTDEVHRYMKCVFEDLDVWDNDNGLVTNHIADILEDYDHHDEMMYVIETCNEDTKSKDTDAWLFDAVNCITSGIAGDEMKDFIREIKKEPDYDADETPLLLGDLINMSL